MRPIDPLTVGPHARPRKIPAYVRILNRELATLTRGVNKYRAQGASEDRVADLQAFLFANLPKNLPPDTPTSVRKELDSWIESAKKYKSRFA